jgi:putative addiction module component (TIGR02574 family)
MNSSKFKAGTYKQQYQYKNFSPEKINMTWTWDDPVLNVLLEKATRKLDELNAFTLIVPDIVYLPIHAREKKMTTTDIIYKEASTLSPFEKAKLIDKLISSLDKPDKEIDGLWAEEVEDRIDAYDKGKLKSVTFEKVLQKYR